MGLFRKSVTNYAGDWKLDNPQDMERLEESKNRAFEYYKEHRNLNSLYYSTNDKLLKSKINEWVKEFYYKLNKEEKKNKGNTEIHFLPKEEFDHKINGKSAKMVKIPQTNKPNVKIPTTKSSFKDLNKKHSYLLVNNLSVQLQSTFGSKLKNEIEEEFLDLDEMVQVDYPKEYNPEVTESLLKDLGVCLQDNRESIKKSGDGKHKMTNDDFRLLLCCLRLKKESLFEKTPYYTKEKFELKDVYNSQLDFQQESNDDVNEFVKSIESEY